jgi:hypothetical protein
MTVPYTFGSATTAIPLSNLDSNFASVITLGNTAVQLGNTITTLTGVTNVASPSSLTLGTNGNTTAVTIDASQNVGLGVTPSATASGVKSFEMQGVGSGLVSFGSVDTVMTSGAFYSSTGWKYAVGSSAVSYYYQSAGQHRWYNAPSGTINTTFIPTQAMTLDASGILKINRTTNSSAASNAILQVLITSASNTATFENSNTTPYGIDVYYSGAAPNNTSSLFYDAVDTSGLRFGVRSNGGIANYSANNVNLSDRREKTNFAPASSYLDKICAIPVQTYNYIDQNMEEDAGLTLGVVAQDVQAVAPELVTESNWGTEKEPKMRLSIYQTDLQYALMKCIQELSAQVTTLQIQVTALQAKVGV